MLKLMAFLAKPLSGLKKSGQFGGFQSAVFPRLPAVAALIMAVMLLYGCEPRLSDDTAAVVNGRIISMASLEAAIRAGSGDLEKISEPTPLKRHILEQLIEEELVVQEAEKRGLKVSSAELEDRVAEVKADYPPGAFEEMLLRDYIDFESWREQQKRNILVGKTIEAETASRLREDARGWTDFFEANRWRADEPSRYEIRHVTTTSREDAEMARKAALKGGSLEAGLKVLGQTVEKNDGESRWVYLEKLPDPMRRAIAGTKAGAFSDIVETEFGFTFFQVVAVDRPGPPDPAEELQRIRRLYVEHLKNMAYDEWMSELKNAAKIVINPLLRTDDDRAEK